MPSGNKTSWVFRILEEGLTDLQEVPNEIIELYMTQISGLLYWASCGEMPDGYEFPENFTDPTPRPELEA